MESKGGGGVEGAEQRKAGEGRGLGGGDGLQAGISGSKALLA